MAGPNEDQRDQAAGQATLPHVDTAPQPGNPPLPEPDVASDAYTVHLEGFDGPLDLLLHLIRKHELDILDIPISFITTKYLEYLDMMRGLHIDVASEYLVMAATLAHIKSKMLLPPDPNEAGDEEGGDEEHSDPRTELVRRLLEYQKYRDAAEQLSHRSRLDYDMFGRGTSEPVAEGEAPLAPVSVFRLFDAFERVLERANQHADHQVLFERVSIAERVVELTELLHDRRRARFEELFTREDGSTPDRGELVLTFLAILEMCKMRVIRVTQDFRGDTPHPGPLGEIWVEFAPKRLEGDAEPPPPVDEP